MRTPTSILALLLLACGEAPPPALEVGPVSYTEDQLLGLTPARRATLAHLTALGLAVADSSFMELGAPLVGSWEEERLLEILAAELTLEKNGVGDDVLEARYLTDPDHELTVRHILFFSERWRTPPEREAAAAKAARALEQLRGGADFAQTAAALSEEPGAEGRQGLLTPGREGAWVDEFWAAASALEPGEISPVTETQYGFHILRLEGRAVVPFAEARSRIAREVADRIEDPRAVLAGWMAGAAGGDSAAARAMALEEAARRGLEVPEGERAQMERRWDDLVYRWSAALGFAYGQGPHAVGEAALAALARTAQGAVIARDEVDAHADLLEARYPVRSGGGRS
ncbi:MAG: hypothetical protein AMXMBFR53_36870 [Gemmatimonadota bacterium]